MQMRAQNQEWSLGEPRRLAKSMSTAEIMPAAAKSLRKSEDAERNRVLQLACLLISAAGQFGNSAFLKETRPKTHALLPTHVTSTANNRLRTHTHAGLLRKFQNNISRRWVLCALHFCGDGDFKRADRFDAFLTEKKQQSKTAHLQHPDVFALFCIAILA